MRLSVLTAVLLAGLVSPVCAADRKQDWPAIRHCLEVIRQCQTSDGMIRMTGHPKRVWTVPYFGNFGAMALLAANEVRPNPEDVDRVQRWLEWYARHQEPDGTIYDRSGSVGLPAQAEEARARAARIAASLGRYWSQQDGCFAYALDMKGKLHSGLSKPYPHGLAQLFALAYVTPTRGELWEKVRERFQPDREGAPIERWLIAATRCASPDEKARLRQSTREAALRFTPGRIYVHRPAVAILALIDGEARFADVPVPGE